MGCVCAIVGPSDCDVNNLEIAENIRTNAKGFLCPFFQGKSEVTSTRLTPRDSAAAPVVPAKHLSTAAH